MHDTTAACQHKNNEKAYIELSVDTILPVSFGNPLISSGDRHLLIIWQSPNDISGGQQIVIVSGGHHKNHLAAAR